MVAHCQAFPIVEAGATQIIVRSGKPEFAYEVEGTFSENTKAGDVAGLESVGCAPITIRLCAHQGDLSRESWLKPGVGQVICKH